MKTNNNKPDKKAIKLEKNKAELEEFVNLLLQRYCNDVPTSLYQIELENCDLDIPKMKTICRNVKKLTLNKYLNDIGVTGTIGCRRTVDRLNELMIILNNRYIDRPAESYVQLIEENKDLLIAAIDLWTSELYGVDAEDYLVKNGTLAPAKKSNKSANGEGNQTRTNSEFELECTNIISSLTKKYGNTPCSFKEIKTENKDINWNKLNTYTCLYHHKKIQEYLIEKGIVI